MKHQWAEEEIEFLVRWYPHFGREFVAEELKLEIQQIASKVDKLKLHMLPKAERLCIQCKEGFQLHRANGYRCRSCFNANRQLHRRDKPKPLKERFNEMLRSVRKRNKDYDIDLSFLEELWTKQEGLCYYSKIPMVISSWGTSPTMSNRNPFSMSLDRVDSNKGYTKDNVVFCCWAVNAGKNNFSLVDYLFVCARVVDNQGH